MLSNAGKGATEMGSEDKRDVENGGLNGPLRRKSARACIYSSNFKYCVFSTRERRCEKMGPYPHF
jgi:hypothetical protein